MHTAMTTYNYRILTSQRRHMSGGPNWLKKVLTAWAHMNDEEDNVDSAVIAMMYEDDNISKQTCTGKPKYTRRGHLRLTRRMLAIAKLVQGAMTASSHAAEALAKTVARTRSYMKLIGDALKRHRPRFDPSHSVRLYSTHPAAAPPPFLKIDGP